MNAKEALEFARNNNAVMVDLRFTDWPGTWQHCSYPINEITEDHFEEGLALLDVLPLRLVPFANGNVIDIGAHLGNCNLRNHAVAIPFARSFTTESTENTESMHRLALTAIHLAIIWAVSTAVVWTSVRLVGRKLTLPDAASVAFVGSLLSVGVLWLPVGRFFGVFLLWTVVLWFLCRLTLVRAAISSVVMQILAAVVFLIID